MATISDADLIVRDFRLLIPMIQGYCQDLVLGIIKFD